jgi:hypothetical protein
MIYCPSNQKSNQIDSRLNNMLLSAILLSLVLFLLSRSASCHSPRLRVCLLLPFAPSDSLLLLPLLTSRHASHPPKLQKSKTKQNQIQISHYSKEKIERKGKNMNTRGFEPLTVWNFRCTGIRNATTTPSLLVKIVRMRWLEFEQGKTYVQK